MEQRERSTSRSEAHRIIGEKGEKEWRKEFRTWKNSPTEKKRRKFLENGGRAAREKRTARMKERSEKKGRSFGEMEEKMEEPRRNSKCK